MRVQSDHSNTTPCGHTWRILGPCPICNPPDPPARVDRIQNAKRERLIDGMSGIIRRMTRIAPRGDLCLADYDERELAIALLGYLEGVQQ
jgi:hypothetical protein